MLRLPLLFLLASTLVLVSCSKEDRFENWLTKKDGKWKVASSREKVVEYTGNDSIVADYPTSDVAGEFVFNEDGTFDYDFSSSNFGIDFVASGERLLDGKTFSHYFEQQSFTEDVIKQWINGEKNSARELQVDFRIEWWSLSGHYLSAEIDMTMERDN